MIILHNPDDPDSPDDPDNTLAGMLYDLAKVQEKLDLNRVKFIILALLMGSDYAGNGVENIGKIRAIRLIRVTEAISAIDGGRIPKQTGGGKYR